VHQFTVWPLLHGALFCPKGHVTLLHATQVRVSTAPPDHVIEAK
jgi:hypothetical protein